MGKDKNKLNIVYKNIDEFKNTPVVNGAFGGYTPDGMLVFNLYFDRRAFPKSLEVEHIEHNMFGNEKALDFEEDVDIIREIVSKVSLRPKVAKQIGKWLIDKADNAEDLFNK